MAPAGVERDGEVGIALARRRRGELGRDVEPVEVDRPAFDSARDGEVEHLVRPLADGGRAEQAAAGVVRPELVHASLEFPEIPADDAERSCSALGAPSGV